MSLGPSKRLNYRFKFRPKKGCLSSALIILFMNYASVITSYHPIQELCFCHHLRSPFHEQCFCHHFWSFYSWTLLVITSDHPILQLCFYHRLWSSYTWTMLLPSPLIILFMNYACHHFGSPYSWAMLLSSPLIILLVNYASVITSDHPIH
jgi:hypothetical protein